MKGQKMAALVKRITSCCVFAVSTSKEGSKGRGNNARPSRANNRKSLFAHTLGSVPFRKVRETSAQMLIGAFAFLVELSSCEHEHREFTQQQ
jgi:hypothetical protein